MEHARPAQVLVAARSTSYVVSAGGLWVAVTTTAAADGTATSDHRPTAFLHSPFAEGR